MNEQQRIMQHLENRVKAQADRIKALEKELARMEALLMLLTEGQ